jgi:capsular exopolysaccharide synthesis family protein
MLGYARSADLTTAIAPAGSNGEAGSFRSQQVGDMTDTLSQASARRIDAQQQWEQVRGTSAFQLPEVQGNNAVQNLYAQRAQLEASLAEERQRHTEEWPAIGETSAKISQLDSQISALASNIKSSIYAKYAAAYRQEQQIAASLAQLRNSAMSERERGVGFNSLKREVETNKAFYDGLLQRYKEVAAASGAPAANITVVDRAGPPLSASSPNVPRDLALAGLTGLILAFLAGAAREGMSPFVLVAEDIERSLNVRTLGVVPLSQGRGLLSSRSTEWDQSQAEAHHSIAVALEQASLGVLPRTLLVTSTRAAEGKSTTALGLAKSLRELGKRVLLVDGDLRHPSFPSNDDATPGLTELLAGGVDPEDVIQQDVESGIHFVSVGQLGDRPVAVLANPDIRKVLRRFSESYDIIIVDGPPILGLADAVLLSRSVEAVVVVVESNRLHWTQLDNALSRLGTNNIVGTVVTKFNAKAAGVRYGSTQYYSY